VVSRSDFFDHSLWCNNTLIGDGNLVLSGCNLANISSIDPTIAIQIPVVYFDHVNLVVISRTVNDNSSVITSELTYWCLIGVRSSEQIQKVPTCRHIASTNLITSNERYSWFTEVLLFHITCIDIIHEDSRIGSTRGCHSTCHNHSGVWRNSENSSSAARLVDNGQPSISTQVAGKVIIGIYRRKLPLDIIDEGIDRSAVSESNEQCRGQKTENK